MREIVFHKGANLIVDAFESDRHNKVGKTTFLKLIDVLLGANGRDRLYKDDETNSVNEELRDIIKEKRVVGEMTLVNSLEMPSNHSVELMVELFPRGRYFFDGEKVSATKYRELLGDNLFAVGSSRPTFRQLIKSFVRVSLSGDDYSFLRTLPRASIADYRAVYNYLFDISDSELDARLAELNRELNKLKESSKQYRRLADIVDEEQLAQVGVALERECQRVESRLDDILDADEFKANRDAIEEARSLYAELRSDLAEIEFKMRRNAESIERAKKEVAKQADLSLSRNFYDEVCFLIPSVNKTFEDMVEFNRALCENEIAYFLEVGAELELERASVQAKLLDFSAENSRYLSLLDGEAMTEYEALLEECMRLRQEMGRNSEVLSTLHGYDKRIKTLESQIANLSEGGEERESSVSSHQDMMNSFNSYFTQMANDVNGERPILTYSTATNKFPVAITDLNGSSTGTRKSLLAVYDLSYQEFAIANRIEAPRFVVQDVVENVEGEDLKKIVDIANGINCQFIIAVLKEKLDSSQIPQDAQDSMCILELSKQDRLFQGPTIEANERDHVLE
ncbi:DUF2326 domain-containing protein [Collinsella sp. AF19-7AC]|uniref:DUF2326 domain-containing protein n=1 Tax=unclassified Collinsella TaxID=2637548 RepID=UPI000E487397|nr:MULTISPECIES: DUF2326 domain-containing protein [unclassified Collinsella]RGT06661.1 DUF2326 domain-containing protein [Collinsella sp. AF19-7AC]RGT33844.1 DUF2326 domain-containing protein [Collinsella sp. AF19-1LB]RHE30507.1 DUF2326 domain-containing protein [Collinsella sp. AM29-10AC]